MPGGNGLRVGTEHKPGPPQHRETNKYLTGSKGIPKARVSEGLLTSRSCCEHSEQLWERHS